MPCSSCSGGMWRLGGGPCVFTSEAACQRAYKAYLAKKHAKGKKSDK